MLMVFGQKHTKIDRKHPSSKGKCCDKTNENISTEFLHIDQPLKSHVTEDSKTNLLYFSTTKTDIYPYN